MVVRRNFQELYRVEEDPWDIGGADSERYDLYLNILRAAAPERGFSRALDLGCGKGAFTSRLREVASAVTGVDVSNIAVAKARASHSGIAFQQGDVRSPGGLHLPARAFDLVVCSDLIYYLDPGEADRFLSELNRVLHPRGRLFLAAWCPGGKYYTPEGLGDLLARRFAILHHRALPSRHAIFVARPRFRDLVLTVDYETWQPVPPGKRIDWEETVLAPAERLMATVEEAGARLTFFVEMGEILWLREHRPETAKRVEAQVREASRRGHDIQLHLHPEWLPEARPRWNPESDRWWWDEGKNRMHRLDEAPGSLLRRLKAELEAIVSPVNPGHRVQIFRAGKYRIQPHAPIFRALREAGMVADSSVWRGGSSDEHRFDFRSAYSGMAPYFPSPTDITLPAAPAEELILEVPIYCRGREKFCLDGSDSAQLLAMFDEPMRLDLLARFKQRHPTAWRRLASRLCRVPGMRGYPRWHREPEGERNRIGDDTMVAIGHTKGDLHYSEIATFLRTLDSRPDVRFRTLTQVVEDRRCEIRGRKEERQKIQILQVERERDAVLGEERNERQSSYLQSKIPGDRNRLLDLGCGAGYWTRRLEDRFGSCVGTDYGEEFLRKAVSTHAARVVRSDFHRLPFPENSFDAVYADNVLEHSPRPMELFEEIYRVLEPKGVLAGALPPDARNPQFPVSNHLWKTDRDDLEQRLRVAGFSRIQVEEVDTVRAFGMSPYPAADNAMFFFTAWKNGGRAYTDRERAVDLMDFVYRSLDPARSQESLEPAAILEGGHAWCLGYCVVLANLARREGIPSRFVTLLAHHHPRGRGNHLAETHELIELQVGGRWLAFDPTVNRLLPATAEALVADPGQAEEALARVPPDDRFRARGYHLYCSPFFYERVVRIGRRSEIGPRYPVRWREVSPPRRAGGRGAVRRLLLTDREDAELSPNRGETHPDAIWTRRELTGLPPTELFRRLRNIPEDRFEVLSEDLAWHERILRVHLLGALAKSREKRLRDRKGRQERLGWGPLLGRQIPRFLGSTLAAIAAHARFCLRLAHLRIASRVRPRVLPARRPRSLVYLRSDLWRGLRAGGSVGHITGMAEGFQHSGYQVSFLAADPPTGIDRDRMPVFEVPPPSTLGISRSLARFQHSFGLTAAGCQRWRKDPPAFVYHRFDEGSIAGILLSRALSVPLVLEYNGSGVWIADHWDRPLPHRRTYQAIEQVNLRHAHLIVTVSRVLKEELQSKGVPSHRILVCPNGVDPEVYCPQRDGSGVRRRLDLEGKTVIGFIGTFGPWHGAPMLARSAERVVRRHPEVVFLFVGEGPELGETREIIRQAGLDAHCRFTGLVPQAKAPDFLAACDLFASPHVRNPDGTRFFGSPTKIFEYLAMGKVVVASRLEQIGDILVDGKTALLVPPGDPAALAAALCLAVGNPDLRQRVGEAGRKLVLDHHTWDHNATAVLDLVRFL